MIEAVASREQPETLQSVANLSDVQDFLTLLARAVQTYRTYPATSPLCDASVSRCRNALVSLPDFDQLDFMVAPDRLQFGHRPIQVGQLVHGELVRRLYLADVAELSIDREVTTRDLSWFCRQLAERTTADSEDETLAAALEQHGIDRIRVTVVERMEVVDAGYPGETETRHIQQRQEMHRRVEQEGQVAGYLYPMDRAWVRTDPGCGLDTVGLADLAILFQDPYGLAAVLSRLSDGVHAAEADPEVMLAEKFGEISSIVASLEPRVAESLFQNLAHAVLSLDSERRRKLLEQTVLPGLLEGRVDGDVLRHLPDVPLAEALALLLDLQVAAPEMLSLALDRLDLPDERRASVTHLMEEHRGEDGLPSTPPAASHDPAALLQNPDAGEGMGLRVAHTDRKVFREYAALNLALDPDAKQVLGQVRTEIARGGGLVEQLLCLGNLLRLRPDPDLAESMLLRVRELLEELVSQENWTLTVDWVARFRTLLDQLVADRPEVADLGFQALSDVCSGELMAQLTVLVEDGEEGEAIADSVVAAFGHTVVPGFAAFVGAESSRQRRHTMVRLMCARANQIGPAVAANLDQDDWMVTRNLVTVLGHAGPGFEDVLAGHLHGPEEKLSREVFQSLARCASIQAAAVVAGELASDDPLQRELAENALWRFPRAVSRRQVRALLSKGDFHIRYPAIARRLLLQATRGSAGELCDVLEAMRSLRFRVWSPRLMRLGLTANSLLKSG
jgi:hypothetical protein